MPNELGIQIRRIRSETGQTQADVAAAAGISYSQLSRIENGKNTGVDVMERLADAVGHRLVLQPAGGDDLPELARLAPADRAAVAAFVKALPRLTARERAVWQFELEMVAKG